jgi:hypothetical protein
MVELPAPIVIVHPDGKVTFAMSAMFVKNQTTLLTTDPMATFIALMAGPSMALRAIALAPGVMTRTSVTTVLLFARTTMIVQRANAIMINVNVNPGITVLFVVIGEVQ